MKKIVSLFAALLVWTNTAIGQLKEVATIKDTADKTKLITNERYVGMGIGSIAGISRNSPYKSGVNLHDVIGFPVLNCRLVLEGQIDFDMRFKYNRDWNTRAYNGWRPGPLPDVFNCLSVDFTLGAYPVIVNKESFSAIAGPMVGIASISARSASGDIMMWDGRRSAFTVCYGLKAGFFLGSHVMMSAQYFMTPIAEVETVTPEFPVTFNALRVCGTYYYWPSTTRRYKKMMARRAARKAKREAAATVGGSSQ